MIEVEYLPTKRLKAYENNARVHPREQIDQIKQSIREFGFTNPILVDKDDMMIAGHGRHQAAFELGLEKIPCIRLEHLSEEQKRAYIIADNKIAENAYWDEALLAEELSFLNGLEESSLDVTGFTADEFDALLEEEESSEAPGEQGGNPYTTKVQSPVYEPTGEKPALEELYDNSKAKEMVERIHASSMPQDMKDFLITAATRHVKFNYHKIAEFYAHADKDVQELFEDSALVIIDFDDALAKGFVKLTQDLADLHKEASDAQQQDA